MKEEYIRKSQDIALLIMRLSVAAIFIFSAWAKWQYLAVDPTGGGKAGLIWFLIAVEPLGALALLVGFLARWAAAGLAIIMVGAITMLRFTAQTPFFTMQEGIGLDYNVLILAGCLILVAYGAGNFSVDKFARKE